MESPAHPSQPLFASQPPDLFRACHECGRTVRVDESIVLSGYTVCAECKPTVVSKLAGGQQIGDGGVWREKKTVVMGVRAVLPDRCVKCNAPAEGAKLKRRLYWHKPAWYALILVNLLVYALAAMIVRKTATIHVGLCGKHRGRRWLHIAIAWGLIFAGIAGIVVGANDQQLAWMIGLGVLAMLTGIIWGLVGARTVAAQKIDEQWGRFSGAGREFLESLGELPKAT